MDESLKALTEALKKLLAQLRPQTNPLSFLIITGKSKQGVNTLLLQSRFMNCPVKDDTAKIFYNQHGVIVDISGTWLNQSNNQLQYTLKKLNSCNRHVKINGLVFCVDINELITSDTHEIKNVIQEHSVLLNKFSQTLGSKANLAILFTKMDLLAGFCDFFQNEHALDILNPLGFSLHEQKSNIIDTFNRQFDHFIEDLSQQVISKIHPVRSSIKRTLIREFPLQISSLRNTIIPIINSASSKSFNLQALYFTSGEQGGVSIDRLNKKIQEEFALTLQNQIHNSSNHRAYFIEGALHEFQSQTKQISNKKPLSHKLAIGVLSSVSIIGLVIIANQYFNSAKLLDKASQDLIAYDSLEKNKNNGDLATLHLAKASTNINKITTNSLSLPTIQKLQLALKGDLNNSFLPKLQDEIEQAVSNSNQPHVDKYFALRTYLMLGASEHYNEQEVIAWFTKYWKNNSSDEELKKKLSLLTDILHNPATSIKINKQIVTDARNYLNALPTSYLYYTLAKTNFDTTANQIEFDGFVIGADKIPVYLTKPGFKDVMETIPKLVQQFKEENWILARQDLKDLDILLQQAYCYEYVIWWQHFIQESHPIHAQSYEDAHTLTKLLRQTNIIKRLIDIIQSSTSPISETSTINTVFNKEIASKFSDINLVSDSSIDHLVGTMNELEKFLNTMSIVNDRGRTAFNLTKARFNGDVLANPLSSLYQQSEQLPQPVNIWAKQIADDIWFSLINNSRAYINNQWQKLVFEEYKSRIADRYPFNPNQTDEISLNDFNQFFSKQGVLNSFVEEYLIAFLDTSKAQWQLKEVNNYVLPISSDMINELIRANVITNMFFPNKSDKSRVEFSIQKINLDPIIANLQLSIGEIKMRSNQQSDDNITEFNWPEANARLVVNSIEGNQYEIEELGTWAIFKILQKLNVLVDEQDSSNLQILFEINGNAGRYLLKAQNPVNPFIPGVLNEFNLPNAVV
ncbi:MAG: type IVB secretion system protein IcmF [Legionellaceae bacterium]|nr:type IVB secretion system protein IcmF [Legionellaceae bacterium]